MSSQATPQQEPTMEEILASIRKIISEDQPPDGAKPAARPAPPPPKPLIAIPEVTRVVSAPQPADLDVLDLTEEVSDEEPTRAVALVPAPVIENDVIFQNVEPESQIDEQPMDDDFISDTTRTAMGNAFANLNGQGPQFTFKAGSIEAIFAEAVQQAFRPVLKEWIDDHSDELFEQLRPLIRAWMDEHLPPLVQAAVIKEITRAAEKARKP